MNSEGRVTAASDGEYKWAAGAWTTGSGCVVDARGTQRRAGMQRVDPGSTLLFISTRHANTRVHILVPGLSLTLSNFHFRRLLHYTSSPLGRPLSGMNDAAVAVVSPARTVYTPFIHG
jgi:hypothetical protein